ncbi:MAG: hypothetical protein K9G62_04055 [Alphaproteobacteria bacterium]|nr:hypothetical protein [Alphaproteobacteria bacterium]
MPTEDRRIFFSHEEVYRALYALCMKREIKGPPPGEIKSVRIGEGKYGAVFLRLENENKGMAETLEYSHDFLAAALMLFCRGQQIPLPRNARKSVLVQDDTVILRVEM